MAGRGAPHGRGGAPHSGQWSRSWRWDLFLSRRLLASRVARTCSRSAQLVVRASYAPVPHPIDSASGSHYCSRCPVVGRGGHHTSSLASSETDQPSGGWPDRATAAAIAWPVAELLRWRCADTIPAIRFPLERTLRASAHRPCFPSLGRPRGLRRRE